MPITVLIRTVKYISLVKINWRHYFSDRYKFKFKK